MSAREELTATLAKLDAKEAKLKAKGARLNASWRELQAERRETERQIRVLALRELVGVKGGVRRYSIQLGEPVALLKVPGTLLEVRRSRGTVVFDGDERKWDWPLAELVPLERRPEVTA